MTVNEILNELRQIQNFVKENNLEDDWIEVRLRFFEDDYYLYWGDPCFDTDHRGNWSYESFSVDSSYSELRQIAKNLLVKIEEEMYV